ncbi:MAG: phage tail protein [Azoarcus sp.]|jgi:hypothetical protein|nr:phage tail protein [Azoarcus sp.]
MIKAESLRAALTAASPYLRQNPQCLHVTVERGEIHATAHGGLSFEYQFDIVVFVQDYTDPADLLFLAIVAWLGTAQPDMLLNRDRMSDFTFEVDVIDAAKTDIEIRLAKLTERVVVSLALATTPAPDDGAGESTPDAPGTGDGEAPVRIPIPEGLSGPGTIATVRHMQEPPVDPLRYVERWSLWLGDDKLREYNVPPFDGPVTPEPQPQPEPRK